jgi:hypothetical protein
MSNLVGRVVPGKPWWTFAFENLGDEPQQRPMRVLPNRLLETAVSISRGGTRGTVFIVTGEITEHRNQNYLLIRKVLVRRDVGNFR